MPHLHINFHIFIIDTLYSSSYKKVADSSRFTCTRAFYEMVFGIVGLYLKKNYITAIPNKIW